MLQPGTMLQYLGLVVCSVPVPHVRVPAKKIEALGESFRGILRRVQMLPDDREEAQMYGGPVEVESGEIEVVGGLVRVKGRTLARLLGMLQSFKIAIPLVAAATKALYACVAHLPHNDQGWLDYGAVAELTPAAVLECKFWYNRIVVWNGAAVRPRTVSRVLYTDGSGQGFGGVIHRVQSRVMEPALQLDAGFWEDAVPKDSVHTELLGLWRELVLGGGELVGQTVLHRTDSISSYQIIRKGGSKSRVLDDITKRVLVYLAAHGIHLAVEYVGADVIIKSGDALSRMKDETDCKLNLGVFDSLWKTFGRFDVDRCATGSSVQSIEGVQLPYWSLWADGMAAGVDAMAADWRGVLNYAFPPVHMVGEVLQLVAEQGAKVVLIAPKWPSQWWWPQFESMAKITAELGSLLTEGPLFLSTRGNRLSHPLGKGYKHPDSVTWVAAYIA